MQKLTEGIRAITTRRDYYLCPLFRGGLGNLMFEYASVYGMAKTTNLKTAIASSSDVFKTFHLSVEPISNLTICVRARTVVEKHPCAFDIENVKFRNDKRKDYIHKSYLQSWKYFSHIEQDIRKQFTFQNHIVQKAITAIRLAVHSKRTPFSKNITVVGIHVRRGDYLKPHNVNYGYQLANKDYIDKAMKYFRERHKNVKFLAFTNPNKDDMKWCKDNIKDPDVSFVEGNPREVDLCALSMCNHTIMTVGSFGWWGSYLANGTTIYFKNVAREGSKLRNDFSKDMSDYFYPGWIGM
ncbi:hypothetical protein FSP39_022263 [Pinctada imbricata]|uniref:L-Fucosyltransferase n=1 Tax=Pinctada imbricata TaxID=66713 RepID=A0AA89BP57_PINIB|nr:hypothetical protein FSP39_022263 [Pinctada imbricata]